MTDKLLNQAIRTLTTLLEIVNQGACDSAMVREIQATLGMIASEWGRPSPALVAESNRSLQRLEGDTKHQHYTLLVQVWATRLMLLDHRVKNKVL